MGKFEHVTRSKVFAGSMISECTVYCENIAADKNDHATNFVLGHTEGYIHLSFLCMTTNDIIDDK